MALSKIVKNLTLEEFQILVKRNSSISDILKELNMTPSGGNHRTLKRHIIKNNIDISHIRLGLDSNKNRKFRIKEYKDTNQIFTENSKISRQTVKRRILKYKLLDYQCNICKMLPIWNDKELVFILDHINGIYNDHRLENLRWVCPNCNSQTDTFAGRNVKR